MANLAQMFPVAAPVRVPAQIIEFRPARGHTKTENLRRARLASSLMKAASRAQNPAIRAVWEAKARGCGYWPSEYLKAEPPVVILAPNEFVIPTKPVPWISMILLTTLAIALTGCVPASEFARTGPSGAVPDSYIETWTDATGCQYLIYTYDRRGGITPRLNSAGVPICKGAE